MEIPPDKILNDIKQLSVAVASDCSLKKGKKTKFPQYLKQADEMLGGTTPDCKQTHLLALAGLYKNIGKLGEHQESIEKALDIIKNVAGQTGIEIRWKMQLAALKSSRKKNNQCYDIASNVFKLCCQFLNSFIAEEEANTKNIFINKILEIANQSTKDQVVWLYNDRSLAQQLLFRLRREVNPILKLPFYSSVDFHIADYMSLTQCQSDWLHNNPFDVKEAAIYLSISCFTMATEKYYAKDSSQKYNHIKALKIAVCAFEIDCGYVSFLLKILNEHFGKTLQAIEEQRSQMAEGCQMKRLLPKDIKQVSLKNFSLPE